MSDRVLYLLSVVAVGWAVTFGLRLLPFLLLAGRNRALPPWAERLGNVISPIIIGGLIAYSYSGLEWRTLWPYLAGALTVGLQLWKRNPLASIVAGTVIYMCLLNLGCTTARIIELDAQRPAVSVKTSGGVYFGEERVEIAEVPEILDDAAIPKNRTIHILIDGEIKDLAEARTLMGILACAGYTRSVLVTKRHAESEAVDTAKRKTAAVQAKEQRPAKRVIRYKGAAE